MPWQWPTSRSISRSNIVRWKRRCASSSFPCPSSLAFSSSSSASMLRMASSTVGRGVT